jgi:hypothetical protein
MVGENILARVGGEHFAAALNTLPDPAVDTEERRETVIEIPELGQAAMSLLMAFCRRRIATCLCAPAVELLNEWPSWTS